MTPREGPASGAGIRRQLRQIALQRREDLNVVLERYGRERLLYRVGRSAHGKDFVLKGATLFVLWEGEPHRPTRDLDLLGYGDPSPARLAEVFRDVCDVPSPEDALTFHRETVEAEPTRDQSDYAGVRVRLLATLTTARIRLQVDVGFGDSVWPRPTRRSFPTILSLPRPVLRAYPPEAVIAEKLEAMLRFGIVNSRMKDFFDILHLSKSLDFKGRELRRAIEETLKVRGTPLPGKAPLALTAAFSDDAEKQAQWRGFLSKNKLEAVAPSLAETCRSIALFLDPVLHALRTSDKLNSIWPAGGPWRTGPRESADAN